MSADFEVIGQNDNAPFTLRAHRGEGMVLLAMDWKAGQPPDDFVGFSIEYQEPGGTTWFAVKNRLSFTTPTSDDDVETSSLLAPIQKFRWVHFPYHAEMNGNFTYRITPVQMDEHDTLSYGVAQTIEIALQRETYPNQLNVAFTRGFVSSQAFADEYQKDGDISGLLPTVANKGLTFKPTHPDAAKALPWMGFEAVSAIIQVLDEAVADQTADVFVIAYDLNEPDVLDRLAAIGPRLKVIIDNSGSHAPATSAESQAAKRLIQTAGADNVKREHMGDLQHNKTIVVSGATTQKAVCGSTNFSWRGFYVQNNSALVLTGPTAIAPFRAAFDQYWASDKTAEFGATKPATWASLELQGIDASVTFSPHSGDNTMLAGVAADVLHNTTSALLYSLAFLYQTPGALLDAIKTVTENDAHLVYGISDKEVGGIEVKSPGGNPAPVDPTALGKNTPKPFKPEPTGGQGVRLHHKFIVIDFDQPTARVYLGSYNFSKSADTENGENLLLIKDRRIAVAYMVEAVRIFDHYEFRVKQEAAASGADDSLQLAKPPAAPGDVPWWKKYYTDPARVRDRKLFAGSA